MGGKENRMTYLDLLRDADRQLDDGRITIGEYEQMIKPLECEVQPKVVRCGECKYYKIDHPKANGYHCCYRCHNIFPMKETDFCSKAERRTE